MTLHKYMDDIGKIDRLSEDDMLNLFKKYKETGSIKIRNKIAEQNLKLVFKVAGMYRGNGIPFSDLVGEGNIGLLRGIEKYDLDKGVKPGYYLFEWIRAMVLRYIIRNAHMVRIGTTQTQRKLFFALGKTKAKALATNPYVSNEEVAKKLNVGVSDVDEMESRLSSPIISIDKTNDKYNGSNYIDSIIRENRADCNVVEEEKLPDDTCERAEFSQYVRDVVNKFMDKLDDRNKEVFKSRFLDDEDKPETFASIAKRIDVTKQRVQQIDDELREKFKKFISHNQITL